jgi:hypothetical protein
MERILKLFFYLVVLNVSFSCGSDQDEQSGGMEGELLFRSGFEPDSRVVHQSESLTSDDDIVGQDLSVEGPSDWVNDIDKSQNLGNFNLQYQGGDSSMRFARIVPEPGNPDNQVLHFRLKQANVGDGQKARIQANIYESRNQNMPGIRELYQSMRLFIPEEMAVLKNYPAKISWLTIMEVWNNIQWVDDPYPFRITVGIGKPAAAPGELHFMVGAEDYQYPEGDQGGKYLEIWHEMNTQLAVPLGKWMELEYYIREGDNETGRFYLAMTPEGGEKQVVFNITDFTHNTKDSEPDGITLWNPMKLYTSRQLMDYVRNQGLSLQVYWDDFSIWKDRRPEGL